MCARAGRHGYPRRSCRRAAPGIVQAFVKSGERGVGLSEVGLRTDGLLKVRRGITTLEEVLKETAG